MFEHGLVLKKGELFLTSSIPTDGSGEDGVGIYMRDTRFCNRFDLTLNGQTLDALSAISGSSSTAKVTLANREMIATDGGTIRARQVMLEERISISDALRVTITAQNFGQQPFSGTIEVTIGGDFRDIFDVRGFQRQVRGEILPAETGERCAVLSYCGIDNLIARTVVSFDRDWSIAAAEEHDASAACVRCALPLSLPSGGREALIIDLQPEPPGWSKAATLALPATRASIRTGHLFVDRVLAQCERDLEALETPFQHGTLPAAGIPWFVAPFGRDSLIVGLQTLHLQPENAIGTLRFLAALQGQKIDPVTEEEPGKILHEMRYGEMARNREVPHRPYFGTVDATPLFAWLTAEVVAWTGDAQLFAELAPHARRAFEWIETYGDVDGDGFVEYSTETRGSSYISHKVWKDSHDSLHYPDGRPGRGLIAAVEVQGYVYAAYARMAEMAAIFGEETWAEELACKAATIRERVEARFWIEDERCYAQALDGEKQPIAAVNSNAGHLLATGLPSAERAALLVRRLAEPDMSSGWGVRTLSSGMPSYNPMSYHNGSIWPHDSSLIAAGCYRYGQTETGAMIADGLIAAATADPDWRLPELYCGFARTYEAHETPVGYPVSCSPQAWASGALPLVLRSMLGLRADTRHGLLVVDPHFPDWLEFIEIRDLQAHGTRGSLTVRRSNHGYEVDATHLNVRLHPA